MMILSRPNKILAVLSVAVAGFPSSIAVSVPADLNNPDIPWQDLRDGLSAEATLLSASDQDYIDQCFPEFYLPTESRTNFRLSNQTSGLCMNQLACGVAENCFPPGNDWDKWQNIRDIRAAANMTLEERLAYDVEIGWIQGPDNWKDPAFFPFNIPSSVLFPAVAGDVVAAVKFAGDNGLELSVKASGHNYAGASSKKDTLLVNTFRYKKYTPMGPIECAVDGVSIARVGQVDQDLANQACLLALARGKNAFIRVGGGEAWVDVYNAVHAFNEAQEAFKYHAVGGGAGSVTPMGWTFQGGLSGTTGARLYGLGMDQVLQIEAVLPNGEHVRFGPTSWEDQGEGYIYPRTTAVSGVCNMNPEGAEEDWKWEACPMDINFDDLWFAFRGGGGGTWGVVTSISLQLHDYRPFELVFYTQECGILPPEIVELTYGFYLDYLLDPAALGVSAEESNSCGSPDYPGAFYCYGEGTGQKFVSTWKSYLQNSTEKLLGMNITEDQIVVASDCVVALVDYARDYVDILSDPSDNPPPPLYPRANEFEPDTAYNFLVPLSSYLAAKEDFVKLITQLGSVPYFSFGSYVVGADDQTTSISESFRNAAFQFNVDGDLLQPMLDLYNISSVDTEIPAFVGGNHFRSWLYGPLKSDPTKVCNFNSLAEADEKCYSVQAAVWGSENLARLEKIKEEIDPNYMFDCNKCVGNNRIKSITASPISPEEEPTMPEEDIVTVVPPEEPTMPEEDIATAAPPKEPTMPEEDIAVAVEGSGGAGKWNPIEDYLFIAIMVAASFIA